jgi:hypothetical protein
LNSTPEKSKKYLLFLDFHLAFKNSSDILSNTKILCDVKLFSTIYCGRQARAVSSKTAKNG